MNNDHLGVLHQVFDLEVISLGDGQWHRIRDFRRDGPTDCPDSGNSNDGTRQDIRENGTAIHYSHEFFLVRKFSSAADATTFAERCRGVPSQRFKLCNVLCIKARQTYIHLN
jgi:hypothetical protein